MERSLPRIIKAMLVSHTLVAIATMSFFLFQMAILATPEYISRDSNRIEKAQMGTYMRSTIKREEVTKAMKANICKGDGKALSFPHFCLSRQERIVGYYSRVGKSTMP
jgi:hypothetical protein